MDLFILHAKNPKEIKTISDNLADKKFKMLEESDNYVLMRKKRYGNPIIHAVCLIIALFAFGPVIIVNVVYFAYSFLWKSPNVLVTTETKAETGDDLEFNTMDEVLMKANALL